MRFPGFIGPSYTLQSVNVDCQRCVNLYAEMDESGRGKEGEVASLVATPGLSTLVNLGSNPIRGSYTSATTGRLFVVSGNTLYEISSTWTQTNRGTLLTTAGPVSMADNGIDLVIVDGTYGYDLTLGTNVFAQITDPNFLSADQVTFQDGYFIFNDSGTGKFFISGLNAVTFNGLDIATAEGSPDNIIGLISNHRDLWLFGTQSTEVWWNSGAAAFPFERMQGAFIEYGCAATFSIAKINNTVFWLGQDDRGGGQIFMANGYQPQRISTHAVEQAIRGYPTINDAVAFTYQENGHYFYVINFTSANSTWVYDTATSLWHERVYLNQGVFERHRANCHAYAFNTHVVGDYQNGKLYKYSSALYSDDGQAIIRQRVTPHLSNDLKRIFYSAFQLDIESGTGIDGTGQGVDPQAMLQFSDDGGHSWSNEKWTSFGKIGQTKSRALWRRLGAARDRVFRVSISEPVKITFIGAEVDIIDGAS